LRHYGALEQPSCGSPGKRSKQIYRSGPTADRETVPGSTLARSSPSQRHRLKPSTPPGDAG